MGFVLYFCIHLSNYNTAKSCGRVVDYLILDLNEFIIIVRYDCVLILLAGLHTGSNTPAVESDVFDKISNLDTQEIAPILVQCCSIVYDAGPTLNQHSGNSLCLQGQVMSMASYT